MSEERTITVNGKQLGKEDVYLDLSKLSKEEISSIPELLSHEKTSDAIKKPLRWVEDGYLILATDEDGCFDLWIMKVTTHLTEITYSQFLELMSETKPKYRFKTLEEFDKEFEKNSDGDYIIEGAYFVKDIFHLAGVPVPDEISEQIMNHPKGVILDLGDIVEGKDNHWRFTSEMLILNEQETENTQVEPFDNSEQFAKNAQTGAENEQVGVVSKMENTEIVTDNSETLEHAKKLLHSNGYFVFPKAPEGDFPDLSDFSGYKMIGQYGTSVYVLLKQGSSFMLDSGKIYDIRDLKPIQPELTPEEIVEKLGKDYLLNLIKEKENGNK